MLGAVRAFQMPAQQSLTPLLVPTALLPRAMAFSSAGQQAAIIGGPALGGLLFVAGMGVVYAASLGLFGVAALLAARLRYAAARAGAADMVNVVIRQTLVQLETPDAMRGRVSAVNSIFIGASNQLGEFESGATAALLGPVGSVVAGGVGTVLVALAWFRLFPRLAGRDRIEPSTPARRYRNEMKPMDLRSGQGANRGDTGRYREDLQRRPGRKDAVSCFDISVPAYTCRQIRMLLRDQEHQSQIRLDR